MTARLSADHRAIDGADAARFLESVKHSLEPQLLAEPARKEEGRE
jgi:pyruvate/2-oxoglutarate dehydrogenase complex dihydrolipoamide acyltransferase (E2) component